MPPDFFIRGIIMVQALYQDWLKLTQNDPAAQEELRAIAGDEAAINDRFYRELSFGTAGMRGVLGAGTNRMNHYNVRRATQGLASYILENKEEGGVLVGYDSRRMSPEFALETALNLAAAGVQAYLFDALRPVALVSFGLRYLGCAAGVVITASHNPKEYNGYKVYWRDGGQLPPDRADAVTASIQKTPYTQAASITKEEAIAKGLLQIVGPEIDEAYYAMVLGLRVNPALGETAGGDVKIVYTPLNGSGAVPVCETLKRAGYTDVQVVEAQRAPDPDFTTVGVPNPENQAAFKLALELAEAQGADLVFATDPDCDRVGVAAKKEDGSYVLLSGNQIGCLLCNYILSAHVAAGTLPKNGAVVKSIVSTQLAQKIAAHYGATCFDVLTGFKFIAEKIQEFEDTGSHTFLFGFEESFGFLSGTQVRDKDGVNAALLLAEMALTFKKQGLTLYQGLMELYGKFGFGAENVTSFVFEGADGAAKMANAMKTLRADPPKALGGCAVAEVRDFLTGYLNYPKSDVLYFVLGGGSWACVRPSGTEPKIKLYVNFIGQTNEQAADMAKAVGDSLKDALNAALN